MPPTKSAAQAADKFNRRASVAGPDYEAGVSDPRRPWAAATLAAEAAYTAGVQAAIARKAFAKGVGKAGDKKWQDRSLRVGVTRFPEGVSAAQGEYEDAMGDVLDTIRKVTLPPRYPKGDPRNYARVQKIGEALHAARIA